MDKFNNFKYLTNFFCYIMYFIACNFIMLADSNASSHDTKMCKKILEAYPNPINALFYFTNSGNLSILNKDDLIPKNMKNPILYYVRSNISSPGGVLVVKTATGKNKNDHRVKLKRGKLTDKEITKNCKHQDDRSKKFYKKYNTHGKKYNTHGKEYASHRVGYKIFQKYVVGNDKNAKEINKENYDLLKGWHFNYKNRRSKYKQKETECIRTDDVLSGNRMQTSLRLRNTGPQNIVNNSWRAINQLLNKITTKTGQTDKEIEAETSNWTVTLLAYDKISKNSSRACIKVTIPELKKAKLIRFNDLSFRPAGYHESDREYLER